MIRALRRAFAEWSARGSVSSRIQIVRCRNGYARVLAPPENGEQYFVGYLSGRWQQVSSGSGLACSDPDIGRALLRACTALEYPTTSRLVRISDPQVAADRLVAAWIRHDAGAALRLTRDEAQVEQLFRVAAPATAPDGSACRLLNPGRFTCAYALGAHRELTVVVAGGASAGYEITGVEFGD